MNRRHEAASNEAEDDTGGEVVFAKSVAELEILVEHRTQRERNGLNQRCQKGAIVL